MCFRCHRPAVETFRKGQAFWQILDARHIPVTVQHMPTNFPPIEAGEALAGMGTPDMRGTLGTFTYFTDDPEELARDVPGGRIVKVHGENGRFILPVEGPPNSLRKVSRFVTIDLVLDVDSEHSAARLSLGSPVAVLKQGEWSDWLRADFPLLGWLAGARGMFRVYVKELHPRLAIYVTPVNIDPRSPDLPIWRPHLTAAMSPAPPVPSTRKESQKTRQRSARAFSPCRSSNARAPWSRTMS